MDAEHYIKAITDAINDKEKLRLWAEATRDLDVEDPDNMLQVRELHAGVAKEIIRCVRALDDASLHTGIEK